MVHDTRWKIIFVSKILMPALAVIILFIGGINAGIITFESPEKKLEGEITATLAIDFGNGNKYSTVITENNEIEIESTYWESFDSIVVDCITYNSIRYASDSNHYWAYYVNGEAGMQGADKQIIENNDLIEWKFEEI